MKKSIQILSTAVVIIAFVLMNWATSQPEYEFRELNFNAQWTQGTNYIVLSNNESFNLQDAYMSVSPSNNNSEYYSYELYQMLANAIDTVYLNEFSDLTDTVTVQYNDTIPPQQFNINYQDHANEVEYYYQTSF